MSARGGLNHLRDGGKQREKRRKAFRTAASSLKFDGIQTQIECRNRETTHLLHLYLRKRSVRTRKPKRGGSIFLSRIVRACSIFLQVRKGEN